MPAWTLCCPGLLESAGQFEPAAERLGGTERTGDPAADRFAGVQLEEDMYDRLHAHPITLAARRLGRIGNCYRSFAAASEWVVSAAVSSRREWMPSFE
jgi:hypothetical protein